MAYTLVTFVFSIVSRAWLMKLLTPWRQTLFTRGTIWESWWLQWTVLQILIMAQPSFRKNEEIRSKLPNVFWSWTEIPPLQPFVNCINELCNGQSFVGWKHFVSQIVYFSVKLPYTVPPDQNNMFSPPPQPKIPLKMQILSKNAIFVTEKVNFYPNNWKFTFLPNRGTTKN